MAALHPKCLAAAIGSVMLASVTGAAAPGAAAPVPAAQFLPNTQLPIALEAQSSELDYRNNVIVFRKLVSIYIIK